MSAPGKEISEKKVNYLVNGEEVELSMKTVRNFLTKGNETVTDQEVVMFINLCKYQKLNPFLNECYLIKFKGAPAQIITSKEAYLKRAEAHVAFDGLKAGLILQRGNQVIECEGSFMIAGDVLLGGWAEVFRKDRSKSYVIKVQLDEYDKGKSTWVSMKKSMIRKVAIVQALREAFTSEMGGLYISEEVSAVPHDKLVHDEIEISSNRVMVDFEEIPDEQIENQTNMGVKADF